MDKKLGDNDFTFEGMLQNLLKVVDFLENPQEKLKNVIHIVGTNGKGSTANFIKTSLECAGYKVGLFTSPHLVKVNERIYCGGRFITDEELLHFETKINEVCEKLGVQLSFFEIKMLQATMFFLEKNVDYCIFEAGLGGRLDATNIFKNPKAIAITSISFDHMEYLGDTLAKIAYEKACVIKKNSVCWCANTNPEIVDVIKQKTKEIDATTYFEGIDWKVDYDLKTSLLGKHQKQNASLAREILRYLKIDEKYIQEGLKKTKWNARLQEIDSSLIKCENIEKIYLDGAHNEDGVRVLFDFIREQKKTIKNNKIVGIFACLEHKDYKSYLHNFKDLDLLLLYCVPDKQQQDFKDHKHIFAKPEKLQEELTKQSISVKSEIVDNFDDANKEIQRHFDDEKKIVFIFGSLYFAGEILGNYRKMQ